jgi:hypothetical protein
MDINISKFATAIRNKQWDLVSDILRCVLSGHSVDELNYLLRGGKISVFDWLYVFVASGFYRDKGVGCKYFKLLIRDIWRKASVDKKVIFLETVLSLYGFRPPVVVDVHNVEDVIGTISVITGLQESEIFRVLLHYSQIMNANKVHVAKFVQ